MILATETVLALYGLLGLAIVLLTIVSKSHKIMNMLAVILPASFIGLALYSLAFSQLPNYALGSSYFLMDHLGIYEVLISAVLFLAAAIYSRGYIEGSIEIGEMDRSNQTVLCSL